MGIPSIDPTANAVILRAVSAIPLSFAILWVDRQGYLGAAPWIGNGIWFGIGLIWFLCFAWALRRRDIVPPGGGLGLAGRRPVAGTAGRRR